MLTFLPVFAPYLLKANFKGIDYSSMEELPTPVGCIPPSFLSNAPAQPGAR